MPVDKDYRWSSLGHYISCQSTQEIILSQHEEGGIGNCIGMMGIMRGENHNQAICVVKAVNPFQNNTLVLGRSSDRYKKEPYHS